MEKFIQWINLLGAIVFGGLFFRQIGEISWVASLFIFLTALVFCLNFFNTFEGDD